VAYLTAQFPKSKTSGKSIIALFPMALIGTIKNFSLSLIIYNS